MPCVGMQDRTKRERFRSTIKPGKVIMMIYVMMMVMMILIMIIMFFGILLLLLMMIVALMVVLIEIKMITWTVLITTTFV